MKDGKETLYRYWLSDEEDCDAFPVEWSKIPQEIASKIPGTWTRDVLWFTKEKKFEYKTVIYLAPIGPRIEIEDDDFMRILHSNDSKLLIAIIL